MVLGISLFLDYKVGIQIYPDDRANVGYVFPVHLTCAFSSSRRGYFERTFFAPLSNYLTHGIAKVGVGLGSVFPPCVR